MPITIFFSWQADTPKLVGRDLIEAALDRAIKLIKVDASIEPAAREIKIDYDTQGAPGSPAIVDTIFQKIDRAAIFVPDLTFVAKRLDGRPSPNPNVLIEYGWALKSLKNARIVAVMNTAYGEPIASAMPFNMSHLRHPTTYSCAEGFDDDSREQVIKDLGEALAHELRIVLYQRP
jgi:hypothetical protein